MIQTSRFKNIFTYALIILFAVVLGMQMPAFAGSLTLGALLRLILLPFAVLLVLLVALQTRGQGWISFRSLLSGGKSIVVFLVLVPYLLGIMITRFGERLNLVAMLVFILVIFCYFLALYFIINGKEHYSLIIFLLSLSWLEFAEWDIGAKLGLFNLMIGEIALPIKGVYIFVASLFGGWAGSRLVRGEFHLTNLRLYVPIALFLLCNLISFFLFTYGHNKENALGAIVNALIVPFLLYILILEVVDTEDKLYQVVYSLIALAVMWSFIRFYMVARGGYITFELEEMEEYRSMYSSAGELALITPLILALLAIVKKRRYVLLIIGLTVYTAVLQLLYFTRSGLLATIAGATCLLTNRRVQLLAILTVIIVFIFWDQIYNNLLFRFSDIRSFKDLNIEYLSSSRWQAWTAALSMLREQPVLGVGLGNFLDHVHRFSVPYYVGTFDGKAYFQYMASAHNLFLQVAALFGLVGVGIILLFLGMLLNELVRGLFVVRRSRLEPLGWGLLGAYVVHIVLAMFGPGFWRWREFMTVTILYWTLFALMVRLRWVGKRTNRC